MKSFLRLCIFILAVLFTVNFSCSFESNNQDGFILLETFDLRNAQNNSILVVNPESNTVSRLVSSPQGLSSTDYTFDPIRRVYYLIESVGSFQKIVGIEADSGSPLFSSKVDLDHINGLQCNTATGNLFGTYVGRNFIGFVEFSPSTGKIVWQDKRTISGGIIVDSSAFDTQKGIYYQQFFDAHQNTYLFAVDSKTHDISLLPVDKGVTHLSYDSFNQRLLGQIEKSSGYSAIDVQSGNVTEIIPSFGGIVVSGGIAVDGDGQIVYAAVVDFGKYFVTCVDLNTGKILSKLPMPYPTRFAAYFRPKTAIYSLS